MDREHKIFLKPEDGVQDAIEKIKKEKRDRVVLHVPEDSVLKSSMDNFYSLKETASSEGKEIVIESVDPNVEELAERAGIKAVNLIFGREEKLISDIIPRGKNRKPESSHISEFSPEKAEKTYEFFNTPRKDRKEKKEKKEKRELMPVDRKKRALVTAGTFVSLVLIGFIIVNILPKADIEVILKKSSLDFDEVVTASASVYETAVGEDGIVLPGELLVAVKNVEKKFPASGEEEIEKKAAGEIYIYNEYSSDPQILVATTRFVSPEGKVFRLDEQVTVPGAEIVGGEIFPSEVKASVTADEAGDGYNISADPEDKWTIPGFKEAGLTKRYDGFYAKAAGVMKGGYSGIAQVPTEEDMAKAEEEIKGLLQSALESQIVIAYSENFKVLDGTLEFEITEMDVSDLADDDGNFSVFAEGQARTFVFEEEALKSALIEKNTSPLDFDFRIIESELKYSEPEVDWDGESVTFGIQGSFVVEPDVNEDSLKSQLVGQTEAMIKPVIFSIPNLEKARISLWPFWVKKVPENPKKINIDLK